VLRAADTLLMPLLLLLLRGWRGVRGERPATAAAAQPRALKPTGQLTPVPPSPQ
jgi:hypothetical protein